MHHEAAHNATRRRAEERAKRQALRRQRARARITSFFVVPAMVLATIVGVGMWGASSASAAAIPAPEASFSLVSNGVSSSAPFILAGEDATFDLALQNTSESAGYNTSFTLSVPNGIDFVSSGGIGDPVIYASGDTLPNSAKEVGELAVVPDGYQLWVFSDAADLPAHADFASTVTVRPDAAAFPVGASPDLVLTGYVSSDPALLPIYDGSPGKGADTAEENTSSAGSGSAIAVQALRLLKEEPSPEIELLRGVHDHQTIYTLTVENTPQGVTDGVSVVDYLPAGLEFLACATSDNTQPSSLLYDGTGALGGTAEYPGAADVTGAGPANDCVEPARVETVDADLPIGLDAGVYTKVTWNLPALSGGTAQATDLTAAGTAGSYVITYSAAVPLFENTMDFVTTDGSGAPAPETRAQGSNLNNNNGASTRQGQGDGFGDGIEYSNTATVSGTYGGPVVSESDREATGTDIELIQAMDVRILKSVATQRNDEFVAGELATYTLDVATSEYMSADTISIVDTFNNGLCPSLPGDTAVLTGDDVPADCAYPSSLTGSELSGAIATEIHYTAADGTFDVTYELDPADIEPSSSRQVVYTALMREAYDEAGQWYGPTTSGDTATNEVELSGWTTSIAALDGVVSGSGAPADGTEDVRDDSSATLISEYSAISKQVLPRDSVIASATPSAAASCAVAPGSPWAQHQTDAADEAFFAGDVVCYELTVDFAEYLDVRNPIVADFLPADVEYVDSSIYTGAGGTTAGIEVHSFEQRGQRLIWELGTVGDGGDRYIPTAGNLVIHVAGIVTSATPATSAALDKPQNLMKYQQEDVLGDVFFLRDASEIMLGQGPRLVKGVAAVDGDFVRPAATEDASNGADFNSNRDGIEVAQGDVVTYRVDLTGSDVTAENLTVWDALPTGITADDVDAIAAGGTAVDPGDAGYPSGLSTEYTGRSVIVWTGLTVAANTQTTTLAYDVTVPVGTLVDTTLDNTASITQFEVAGNAGTTPVIAPSDSLDTEVSVDAVSVPGDGMRDDSSIFTPAPHLQKSLVATEIAPNGTTPSDPNNGVNEIVEGEVATWEYSVTIPAGTSVSNAVLRDRGTLNPGGVSYTVAETPSWSVDDATVDRSEFDLDATTGQLEFPSTYTNSSGDDQTFTVVLKGYVGDVGADGTQLANRSYFESDSWSARDDARVTYIEPDLTVVKTASPASAVTLDDIITYTVRVTNPGSAPVSYDNVVVDSVPTGIIVDASTITGGGVLSGADVDHGGGEITWLIDEVPAAAEFTYAAAIDPTTGGAQQYENTVVVDGHTLPDSIDPGYVRGGEQQSESAATVTAATAAIEKGVRAADTADAFGESITQPAGALVEYQVQVVLEPGINYYNPVITDSLPAGAKLQSASVSGPTVSPAGSVPGTWDFTEDSGANSASWTYNDGSGHDISSSTEARTLTLTYDVLLDGTAIAHNVSALDNTASFSWGLQPDGSDPQSVQDEAEVVLVDPVLNIDKGVSDASPNPGETFSYEVSVTNTGGTTAFNMVITDVVPAGVIVNESSISHGGALSGADAATGGGLITWDADDLPGPLHVVGTSADPREIILTYEATVAASAYIGNDASDVLVNTASVDHFESFSENGREYDPTDVEDTAAVDPPFPFVTGDKAVTTTDIAYADEPLSWTLTATNRGDGIAQTATLTDTLPTNWTYTEVTSITVAGSAWTGTSAPLVTGTGASGAEQTLTWDFGADVPAAAALQPGESIVIVFTATPGAQALVDAGTTGTDGTRIAHTNTVTITATDTSGATENADGPFAGPDADADAYIERADLLLVKGARGGNADGQWIAGGAVDAQYTQPQWLVTVTNQGPDASVGPFQIVDSTTLPAGVTMSDFTALYVMDGADEADGVALPLSGAGTESDPLIVGDASISLPADGSDRIVLIADVHVGADATGSAENIADVLGRTWETPEDVEKDNEDDATQPIVTLADLQLTKTTASVPNAGGQITWGISIVNNGPSVSVSTPGDLITVTDTIPAGVANVADPSTNEWAATASDGFPAEAGDDIVWTYVGESFSVNAPTSLTLAGTVEASWQADTEIVNAASVAPGVTTDPDPENNVDDTTVTPGTDTNLGINKTRVVWDGTGWVAATSADAVTAGEGVTYLVEVTNRGTADARGIEVVDAVEPYFVFESFESVLGTWMRTTTSVGAGGDQNFTLSGSLLPAETASFLVTLRLDSAHDADATVENTVTARADNSTNEPTDTDSTNDSERSADLIIEKSHEGAALAGQTLDYTLRVTNLGPSVASGPVTVTDTLPDGFTYVAGSATAAIAGGAPNAVDPDLNGDLVSVVVGGGDLELAQGDTIVVTLSVLIDAGTVTGEYINTARVDSPDDQDPSNNEDEDPTNVSTMAELSIVKDAAPGPYVAGASVDYTITVANQGPSVARAVVVTENPPAEMTITAMAGDGWDCDVDALTCTRDELGLEQSSITVTSVISASVTADSDLQNIASVTASTNDRDPGVKRDDEIITVETLADLGLSKTAVDSAGAEITTVAVGDDVRYALDVHNYGPSDAGGPLVITDVLPDGLTFIAAESAGDVWSCATDPNDPQNVVCEYAQGLAMGADAPRVTLQVAVDPAHSGGTITNTAVVSSATPEPTPDVHPNTDDAVLDAQRHVDVSIQKTHAAGDVRIGDELTFDLAVRNDGPSTATDVTVVDTIPAGLTYASAKGSAEAWTVTAASPSADGTTVVTAVLTGGLAPDSDAPRLAIGAIVTAESYDTVVNTAVVSAAEEDVDPSNNESDDTVVVPAQSALVVTKELASGLMVGQKATYGVTLTNMGLTEDPGAVMVSDVLPEGLSFVSAAGDDMSCQHESGVVTCALDGALAVGETRTIAVTVYVEPAAYPQVTNVVTISTPTEQGVGSVLSASTTDPVTQDPLATTGAAPAWWLAVLGIPLLVAGGILLLIRRRRSL